MITRKQWYSSFAYNQVICINVKDEYGFMVFGNVLTKFNKNQ